MATSIHVPRELLQELDERAASLGISRNRLILRALERELRQSDEWSPEFLERLGRTDDAVGPAVDEMLQAIRRSRRSKGAPDL